MRIFGYMKNHVVAIIIVFVLLICQAFCDLSLPRYTSDIVDVGIQQAGIADAAPSEMRETTYKAIDLMLTGDDAALFEASYAKTDAGTYALTDSGSKNRDQLNSVVALPEVIVYFASQAQSGDSSSSASSSIDMSALLAEAGISGDASAFAQMGSSTDSISALVAAADAGVITKDQVASLVDALKSQLSVSDSVLEQQGVAAAKAEYAALGYDMDAMQFDYLLKCGLFMMGFVIASVIVAALVGLIASRTGAQIGRGLRSKLFAKVVSFSDAEIQHFSAASLITRATNDIQQIQMVSILFLRVVLYAPILAVGGIIMVAQTNLAMGWVILVGIVAVMLVVVVLMGLALPKFKVMQKLIDRVNLISREMLTGVPVVRAFGRQQFEQTRFDGANTVLMKTQLFANRVMTFMMPAMTLVMNALSALIIWVGAGYIDAGTIQTGDLIAFITYCMVVIAGFLMIGMIAMFLPRAEVAAGRINEVLETPLSIDDPASDAEAAPQAAPAAAASAAQGAEIAFNHVSFKYGDSVEYVLEDINFTAEAGKTLAIIGSTGSGKSTVIKLIERFYDATEGSVTIDGVDVRTIKQSDLRAQLGYVPQKAFLFTGTVASNIGYGQGVGVGDALSADEADRINAAIDIAQARDFVDGKEAGLNAEITQGGTNVSGGQRQRLAIARALATDARAYLFDDSFSALDYKTDALLRQALATQMKGKTVIIVAQRIATVLSADKIIVLDEGRMVGQGTHDQLLQSCDQYREIALSQLSASELEGGAA